MFLLQSHLVTCYFIEIFCVIVLAGFSLLLHGEFTISRSCIGELNFSVLTDFAGVYFDRGEKFEQNSRINTSERYKQCVLIRS